MIDAISACIVSVINVSLGVVAWRIVRFCYSDDTFAQCVSHVLVAMWAALVLLCVVLGAIGAICPIGLGVGALVVAGLGFLWLGCQPLPVVSGITSGTDLCCGWAWQYRATILGWSGLGTVIVAGAIEGGSVHFPGDWDSLMYHVPLIDQWIHAGSLYAPADAVWYSPGNAELIGLWLVAPFSGDFWVGLANAPVALLLVLGNLELGRQLGMTPALRHAVAVSVVANHVFLRQVATNENDLAVAGLFCAGIAYGMRYICARRAADLALASASLGLLAGVKYYALGYAAVAWLGILSMTFDRRDWRGSAHVVLVGMVGTVALAGYWYGRNLWLTGNPLYQLVAIERTSSFLLPGAWSSSLAGNGRIELLPRWLKAVGSMTGLCQVTSVLVLPLSLAWLVGGSLIPVTRRGGERKAADLRRFLAFLILGSYFIFGITPFTVARRSAGWLLDGDYLPVRFSQCPLILSTLAFGVMLCDVACWLRERWRLVAWGHGIISLSPSLVLMGLVAAQAIHHLGGAIAEVPSSVAIAAADLVAFGLLVPSMLARFRGWKVIAVGMLVVSLVAAAASAYLSRRWHGGFAKNYDKLLSTSIFSELENARPQNLVLAVLDYRYYPFFGSRRQFRVHRPERIRSESSLFRYLAANRIDIVSVVQEDRFLIGRYRDANIWVRRNPSIFKYITSTSNCDIFRIDKASLTRRLAGCESGPVGKIPWSASRAHPPDGRRVTLREEYDGGEGGGSLGAEAFEGFSKSKCLIRQRVVRPVTGRPDCSGNAGRSYPFSTPVGVTGRRGGNGGDPQEGPLRPVADGRRVVARRGGWQRKEQRKVAGCS